MKSYIEYTKDMNEEMKTMEALKGNQDHPCVGIFWYDDMKKVLFGVEKEEVDTNIDKTVTSKILHVAKWKKEFNKQKFKNNGVGLFHGDYKDVPRGRIFYIGSEKKFEICVGSWIKDNEEAKELILDEFDLWSRDVEFVIDYHWDLGSGWENF